MVKRITCLFAALWLFFVIPTNATDGQTLIINGETVTKTVAKMTFDGDNVVLHFADASQQSADMGTVSLSFQESSSIPGINVGNLRGVVDNLLTIKELKEGTEVMIYDAAGKRVMRSTVSSISVSQLKSGIYLLKAGNQIVKFVKR